MASRAKVPGGPGGLKAPLGKLGRGGPALRPPSGSGMRKQSPLPLPGGPTRTASRTPVKSATPTGATNTGTANGQQDFRVGSRVRVNGKTGTLAFLGPTQFALGTWAGIVLDTNDGKNNGIVKGVQYFECEANRGLFSRPDKLMALPSSAAEVKGKNQAAPNSSPARPMACEVGDRVSIDGVKEGNVAFIGETQFSKGVWVGVVLDTAEGKNSGSVGGVQYFECEANHGLFAKPEKLKVISKSSAAATRQTASSVGAGQFEIGDRVLVDGLKEGMVGFLGETKFAQGVWAGIVLDVPEGKNNGCVKDVQYFSCEPNHGLFTKPSKLQLISKGGVAGPTKTPVQDNGEGGAAGMQPNPVTPVDLKILQDKLSVGDHVLVSGVKEGILKFIGPTEFAKGVWVGVELPGPMGKNDGAVSGKRSVFYNFHIA